MQKRPEKTVRFAQVVQEAGRPETYTLWQAPDKDPEFRRAVREDRVMTIVQAGTGTKKDYGLVGYHQEKNASYIIFPKSLQKFEAKKIIGIKYDLLAETPTLEPVAKPDEHKPKAPTTKVEPKVIPKPAMVAEPKEQEKSPKKYLVKVALTAELEFEEQVEAANQAEARKIAEAAVRNRGADFSKSEMKIRVRKVKAA